MSWRAIGLGLALGLFVSGFTFLNDAVIRQSWFINHHLPPSVFGFLILLLLVANPLLRLIGPRWPLRAGELAVVVAIALASCGWPSFGFYWGFVPNVAMPLHHQKVRSAWQSTEVLSYVPGGPGRLAAGHVSDWQELTRRLAEAADAPQDVAAGRLWMQLSDLDRQRLSAAWQEDRPDPRLYDELRQQVNRLLESPRLFEADAVEAVLQAHASADLARQWRGGDHSPHTVSRINRWVLHDFAPDLVMPPLQGSGVLLEDGDTTTPALAPLLMSDGHSFIDALSRVPWQRWWPTLRLWGGVALLVGLASLCLTLIVHPQWSRHELQPYPIARLVSEVTRQEPGSTLPVMFRQTPFWIGLGGMLVYHGLNGTHAWFPQLPQLPQRLDFSPLAALFPVASSLSMADVIFAPYLYFSVMAFAMFLRTPVAFSVGFAPFAYMMLASVFAAQGMRLSEDRFSVSHGGLLRFGAYFGMACMIIYLGRRYYLTVAMRAVGMNRSGSAPAYAFWATRGLAITTVLAVALLWGAGVSWPLALMFVGLVLLMMLVMTRIVVETGIFFLQSWWIPVVILTALLGFEAVGPTNYIVLAVGSIMLVGDPRTVLMPYLANALQMSDATGEAPPRKMAPWLALMLMLGLVVAGVATLGLVHLHSTTSLGQWTSVTLPSMPFDRLSLSIQEVNAVGTIDHAVQAQGAERVGLVRFDGSAYRWMLLGVCLVIGAAVASLRLPWWPIHPVLFLIWGTMPASRLGASFLLGWLIKLAVVHLGGAKAHRAALPAAVGVIAGELLAGLLWTVIGATYYFVTHMSPVGYRIHY